LSGWETTNFLSLQKCTKRINSLSSIFVNYCKLSSIIVRMSDNESLTSSEMHWKGKYFFVKFRHLLYIIVNYCVDERQRISYLFRNALKGWIFFCQFSSIIVNYRQLLSGWETTNFLSLQKCTKRINSLSSNFVIYCNLSSIIVRMRDNESLISSKMLLKVEYFFINFRQLL